MGDVSSHKRTGVVSDITRGTAKALTYTAFALTLAFGGTRLFSEARADPPKPIPTQAAGPKEEVPPGSKEERTPIAPKPLDPELAKLKKVSLGELQRLDKESSEKYTLPGEPRILEDGMFVTYSRIVFEGKTVNTSAQIVDLDKWHNDGSSNKQLLILVDGRGVSGGIDLNPLDKLYQKATGNVLRYVRLIVESGKDEDGAYVSVTAVPVQDLKNGKITDGIPVCGASYIFNTGEVFSGFRFIANDVASSK